MKMSGTFGKKIKAKTIMFLVSATLALLVLSNLSTCYAASGYLEGTIADMGVIAPLADATVTLKQGTTTVATTTTDAAGIYEFVIAAGDYDVIASKIGYISRTAHAIVADGFTTTQDFNLERTEPVVNRGFETGSLAPWTNHGGAPAAVTDTISHTGDYSLKTGGFTFKIVRQEFSTAVEAMGRLIFWVYVPADLNPAGYTPGSLPLPAKAFSVEVSYLEAPGTESLPTYISTYSAGWHKIVLPFSEGRHVTKIEFHTGEIADLYIDDVSLPRLMYYFESCNSLGATKDIFNLDEDIYVTGSGWPAMPPAAYRGFKLMVVKDATWIDGMPIPAPAVKYVSYGVLVDSFEFAPDNEGNFIVNIVPGSTMTAPETFEPAYLAPGFYDIIVDVNSNGVYDEGVDVLDDMDIMPGGLFVVPEVPLGAISAVAAMVLAFGLVKRRGNKTQLS